MSIIGICGNFGYNNSFSGGGQIVKTRLIKDEISAMIGTDKVQFIDTHLWRKHPLRLVVQTAKLALSSDNLIIMPAKNGIKVFLPFFLAIRRVKKIKINYIVIGGWLPEYIQTKKWLLKKIRKIDNVFVETDSMKIKLIKLGVKNTSVMPNFKRLKLVDNNFNFTVRTIEPLKICTFSRVLKEKGIEDIVQAINEVNELMKKDVYHLDIYGHIDDNYDKKFKEIIKVSPSYINYKGIVDYDNTVDTIKNYFLLVFPTYYQGEGFPGTIIDAFSSGVPVLASDWKYNKEIIDDFQTGLIFKNKNIPDLVDKLIYAYHNKEIIMNMVHNCIIKAKYYSPDKVINDILRKMDIDY